MEISNRIQPQQLIDQHRNFTRSAIQNIVHHLPEVQKQYFSVAIIGVQNSGKSTLLNHLFGTNFQVLQQIAGTRTTRGILTSLDKQQNFIIMDVEGNDSMDRIQEHDYEKMVATFALVSADVLIINVWSHTLGQYTGSQYQTLHTILDICISQFKQQSPKTILFCVRDFNDQVDDEGEIRRKIVKDVNNIWLKTEKPSEYEKYQNTPEKFFNVEVAVLRKYKPQNPKNFLADIQKLRRRFIDLKEDGYIFAKKKTAFNLPLKDLPQLQQNSWQQIKKNKKLNLPNEKQQLSNFRCSEILKQLSLKFQQQIKHISENHSIEDFGKIQQSYVNQFEKNTYLYGKNIVEEKQKIFKQQIIDTIKKIIEDIIEREQKKFKDQFKNYCLEVNQKNSMSLQGRLNQIKLQLVQKLTSVFKIINYQVQGRKEKIQKLIEYFNKQIVTVKNRIIETINCDFQKQYSRSMRLLSTEVLNKFFGGQFWSHVNQQFSSKKTDLLYQHEQKIKWADNRILLPAQIDKIDEKMSQQLKNSIKQELQKSLINKVFDLFLIKFTKNSDGASYNFNIIQQKKIAEIYDQAREQCQDLVKKINLYDVQRSNKSSILVFENEAKDEFFESTWLSNALNELDKKMMNQHQTVIRRKKQSQMRKVPWWLFVIIMYFVYDDLWFPSDTYPISNSILTLFLIFITFFFAIGQQSAFMELWNLALDGMKSASEIVKKKINKQ